MQLALTTANYGRPRADLPQPRLVNAYIEGSPGGPTESVRTARPGLTPTYSNGTGPVLAVFEQPGLFNGDVFSVSGSKFFRNGVEIATVAYSTAPQMAAANGLLALVSGGALYIYDGTTLTPQLFFDDFVSLLPPFSGVSVLYNIFVYPVVGSDTFFFSAVGSPGNINALNFSTVQTAPDQIVQSFVLAEELYFFGQTSVEIWDFTGSLTAPFALSPGRTYARGCAAQTSVQKLDNSLFWVGDDFTVYRSSQIPVRISTSFIEDRLKKSGATISQMGSMKFNIEGHAFYVINLPALGESYAYDCQSKEWARWGTYNGLTTDPGVFIGNVASGQGDQIYVGSSVDGTVWTLDETNFTDGGLPIQVVATAAVLVPGGVHRCNNVSLQCVRGVATSSTPDPVVQMRYSDDGGRTWTSWITGSLGFIGTYTYKSAWRSLGIIKQPGRYFEFKIADPVNVTIEGVSVNEARI